MMKPSAILGRNIRASIETKQRLLALGDQLETFDKAVEATLASYRKGGRLYIAGNGGSAADAQHLAAEFVSKLAQDREPIPAEALTVDSSILTAIGNDYGYEQVFARQLRGKAGANDIFLGITTSGNSPNIIEAVQTTARLGIPSIIFGGRDGGKVRALATHTIIVPSENTALIQETHIVLAHTLCECIEASVMGWGSE